jgi:hypothetical protein
MVHGVDMVHARLPAVVVFKHVHVIHLHPPMAVLIALRVVKPLLVYAISEDAQ